MSVSVINQLLLQLLLMLLGTCKVVGSLAHLLFLSPIRSLPPISPPPSSSSSKKGSKKDSKKDSKSEKSEKSTKAPSSKSGSSKSQKSTKAPSGSSKSGSKSKSSKKSSRAPTETPVSSPPTTTSVPGPTLPPIDPIVPEVLWKAELVDAVNTGELFYDPTSSFGWYTYNAAESSISLSGDSAALVAEAREVEEEYDDNQGPKEESERVKIEGEEEESLASSGPATDSDTAKQLEEVDDATLGVTYGKICAIDSSNGSVMTPCQEIRPVIGSATSTEIQSIEACYDENDGAIVYFAVIVHDQTKFLQFTTLVGSRLVLYRVSSNGNSRRGAPIDIHYEGWASIYGEPMVSGRPTFSKDCETLYATWITNPKFGSTLAVSTAISTVDGAELWRTNVQDGTAGALNRRFVGFGLSRNGETLYSATNLPGNMISSGDTTASSLVESMGIYALDASTGGILREYKYDDDGGHNAYANILLDGNDDTYHIDRVFGLVKFDGPDLSKGPVWKSTTPSSVALPEVQIRRLSQDQGRFLEPKPLVPEDKILQQEKTLVDAEGNSQVEPNNVFSPAAAYRPALDGSSSTVFAYDRISMGRNGETGREGDVNAVVSSTGDSVWASSIEGAPFYGTTDDTLWAPARGSRGGNGGVYTAAGPVIQCQDSEDGALLWRFEWDMEEENGDAAVIVSKITIVSDESVLVAADGIVEMLQTAGDVPDTPSRPPVTSLPPLPTSPIPPPSTRMPVPLPTSPVPSPTTPPTTPPPISSATSMAGPHFFLLCFSAVLVVAFLSVGWS